MISKVTLKATAHLPERAGLKVETPFHPEFPEAARKIGGSWYPERKAWYFDYRDEQRVRELVARVYGAEDEERVTVQIAFPDGSYDKDFYALGRQIWHQWGRDSKPLLGDGVVLECGTLSGGGSRRYPCTFAKGVVLEVRDVPASRVVALPDGITIVSRDTIPAAFSDAFQEEDK